MKAQRNPLDYEREGWLGPIGVRKPWRLRLMSAMHFDNEERTVWQYVFRTDDHNRNLVLYRGEFLGLKFGQTVTIKATVKDCSTYRGEPQTRISRPVLLRDCPLTLPLKSG